MLTPFLSAKAAAAAAAAIAGVGGFTAAAYAGALPGSVQRFAHSAIGAPPAPAPPVMIVAPVPLGRLPEARLRVVLCVMYEHGTSAQQAEALPRLAKLAGDAGKVSAYCDAWKTLPPVPAGHFTCWPIPLPTGVLVPAVKRGSGAGKVAMPPVPSSLPTCVPIPVSPGKPVPLPRVSLPVGVPTGVPTGVPVPVPSKFPPRTMPPVAPPGLPARPPVPAAAHS